MSIKTIQLLREVIGSPDCKRMNLSTVKGYLGELLVKDMLESEGVSKVEHLGNQSGHDLEFTLDDEIRVDVKMSTPKDEYSWGAKYWGWALVQESKKKKLTATHYVCVGCSNELGIERIFVVAAKDVSRFPQGIGQFSKVKHRMILLCGQSPSQIKQRDGDFLKTCAALKEEGVFREVANGEKLSDCFV
jgi:hypothetical protein